MKVGVVLHAVVNLAFAGRVLASPAGPPLPVVRPLVQPGGVVLALPPAAEPSGPPIGVASPSTVAAPASTVASPAATVRVVNGRAPKAAPRAVTSTTAVPRSTASTAPAVIDRSPARFDRLADCESDGDPTAVNGPYRGAFQFLLDTWHDAGGVGDPVDASYEQQRSIAISWSRVVDPASQWPVCWPATA